MQSDADSATDIETETDINNEPDSETETETEIVTQTDGLCVKSQNEQFVSAGSNFAIIAAVRTTPLGDSADRVTTTFTTEFLVVPHVGVPLQHLDAVGFSTYHAEGEY